ncbi:MAG TPA: GNAT family N-acetyltransferase [Steroidobacteraceae bacterium]|nr:GNAT family N-acetyltransferase [Steroidobacteraceae bacterium]
MLQLRDAQAADVPVLYQLIGELADYERLRHRVVGTPEDLRRHLFGEPRYAAAMLAFWNEELAGYSLYFHNYSTFQCRPGLYLEDLFVRPGLRGRGIGRELLLALERRARELGCGRLEWSVLDWNQGAIEFYRRFGAAPNEGWTLFRKELS